MTDAEKQAERIYSRWSEIGHSYQAFVKVVAAAIAAKDAEIERFRSALQAAENRVKSLEALLEESQLYLAEDWRDRRDVLLAEGKK